MSAGSQESLSRTCCWVSAKRISSRAAATKLVFLPVSTGCSMEQFQKASPGSTSAGSGRHQDELDVRRDQRGVHESRLRQQKSRPCTQGARGGRRCAVRRYSVVSTFRTISNPRTRFRIA